MHHLGGLCEEPSDMAGHKCVTTQRDRLTCFLCSNGGNVPLFFLNNRESVCENCVARHCGKCAVEFRKHFRMMPILRDIIVRTHQDRLPGTSLHMLFQPRSDLTLKYHLSTFGVRALLPRLTALLEIYQGLEGGLPRSFYREMWDACDRNWRPMEILDRYMTALNRQLEEPDPLERLRSECDVTTLTWKQFFDEFASDLKRSTGNTHDAWGYKEVLLRSFLEFSKLLPMLTAYFVKLDMPLVEGKAIDMIKSNMQELVAHCSGSMEEAFTSFLMTDDDLAAMMKRWHRHPDMWRFLCEFHQQDSLPEESDLTMPVVPRSEFEDLARIAFCVVTYQSFAQEFAATNAVPQPNLAAQPAAQHALNFNPQWRPFAKLQRNRNTGMPVRLPDQATRDRQQQQLGNVVQNHSAFARQKFSDFQEVLPIDLVDVAYAPGCVEVYAKPCEALKEIPDGESLFNLVDKHLKEVTKEDGKLMQILHNQFTFGHDGDEDNFVVADKESRSLSVSFALAKVTLKGSPNLDGVGQAFQTMVISTVNRYDWATEVLPEDPSTPLLTCEIAKESELWSISLSPTDSLHESLKIFLWEFLRLVTTPTSWTNLCAFLGDFGVAPRFPPPPNVFPVGKQPEFVGTSAEVEFYLSNPEELITISKKDLLLKNRYFQSTNGTFWTLLHAAVDGGNTSVVSILLDAKNAKEHANPNAITVPGGSTPVHIAASKNHDEIMLSLLRAGGDPNAPNEYGYTPGHDGACQCSKRSLCHLVNYNLNLHAKDDDGWRPLDRLFRAKNRRRHPELLVLLDPDQRENQQSSTDAGVVEPPPFSEVENSTEAQDGCISSMYIVGYPELAMRLWSRFPGQITKDYMNLSGVSDAADKSLHFKRVIPGHHELRQKSLQLHLVSVDPKASEPPHIDSDSKLKQVQAGLKWCNRKGDFNAKGSEIQGYIVACNVFSDQCDDARMKHAQDLAAEYKFSVLYVNVYRETVTHLEGKLREITESMATNEEEMQRIACQLESEIGGPNHQHLTGELQKKSTLKEKLEPLLKERSENLNRRKADREKMREFWEKIRKAAPLKEKTPILPEPARFKHPVGSSPRTGAGPDRGTKQQPKHSSQPGIELT